MGGWQGNVLAIHITGKRGEDLRAVDDARVVEGRGLEDDRNWARAEEEGFPPKKQVTFIEREALDALARDYGIEITAAESRRNVLTEGAPLNHLVDRRFRVGECEFIGRELCEPCGYLQSKTKKGVVKGLIHRGGLRAEIVTGGTIRAGDAITEA